MGMAMMGTAQSNGESRAREATEGAIKSPLLEDVDLDGAKGILVNVTAGAGLTIGEFTQVGECVEEFASEDATVVVGTVIDESMQEDIKVTIVATGLGEVSPPNSGLKEQNRNEISLESEADRKSSFIDLDEPAYKRKKAYLESEQSVAIEINASDDLEFLDVPAFLRRQAD